MIDKADIDIYIFFIQAKGISVASFLKSQEELVEKFDSGFSGYRGLSGKFRIILKKISYSNGSKTYFSSKPTCILKEHRKCFTK